MDLTKPADASATTSGPADGARLSFRPLHRQVRDMLVRRIIDGVWTPGAPLPSELQLAADLGVSQGTVRKALDAMAAENLVVRRQGRGTFVARPDEERVMFQFFKLASDEGPRSFPQSRVLAVATARANVAERKALALPQDARVVRIRRLRSLDGAAAISERIVLPDALFPGLVGMELPNNLYGLYAIHFGVTVASTRERLKAIAAPAQDAEALSIAPGAPVLEIDRLARSLENTPVEWRVSVCLTERLHYLSDLR